MPSTPHRPFAFAGTLLMALAAVALIPAPSPAVVPAAAVPAAAAPAAAAPAAAAPAGNAPEALQVEQAWIRWLPANLPAGGYLIVSNRSAQPVVLVGASSPDYAGVGLHRSLTQGGVSRMEPVTQIVIAPHTQLNFANTGYHIMLTTPTRPVAAGDRVPITLHFADGRSLVVNFEVRPPNATAPTQAMPAMPGMPDMPGMPGMPAKPAKPH